MADRDEVQDDYSKLKFEEVYTLDWLNYFCFIIGVTVVWVASHDWLAVVGCVIAALHFDLKREEL